MRERAVTLVDLCEPLFQYACLLNRSARKGAPYGVNQVRAEVQDTLGEIRARAQADPQLANQYRAIEPVLLFFVDATVKSSSLPFARDWQDLAEEYGESNGDERFFDLLDDALRDPSPGAVEQLRVFYTCLGLGFTGWYAGQPDLLRKRMMEISARIRGMTESAHASRIVPEAYEHVNTGNLIDPPGASLLGIGIAVAGLLIVVLVANVYLYQSSSRNLDDAVQYIIGSDAGGGGARAAPARKGAPPARDDGTAGAGGGAGDSADDHGGAAGDRSGGAAAGRAAAAGNPGNKED